MRLWPVLLGLAVAACAPPAAPPASTSTSTSSTASIAGSAPLGANEVKALVYEWFALFDRNAPVDEYLVHLDDSVAMKYPETAFHGKDGFRAWYAGILRAIRVASHDVGPVEVTLRGPAAHVVFEVLWQATTVSGEPRRLRVRQTWDVARGASGRPLIRALSVDVLPE